MTFTKLGLVGHPVAHSISPVLHNAALRHHGLSGDYILVDVLSDDLPATLSRLAAEGFVGVNVTVPHKQNVIPHMASLTATAGNCGAVNTIKFRATGDADSRPVAADQAVPFPQGHNTDLAGFLHALSYHGLNDKARGSVVVLGAGGAARAALCAFNSLNSAAVTIAARRREPAEALIADLRQAPGWQLGAVDWCSLDDVATRRFDLIINCTALGVTQSELPAWAGGLLARCAEDGALYDMVYGKSLFGKPCQQLHMPFADGLEMLLGQAALAFEFWTGLPVPVSVMRAAAAQRK